MIITAKNYNIYRNKNIEFMILSFMWSNEPPSKDAYIVYDGGEHALLFRDEKRTIILDYIHPEIREQIKNAGRVLVCEIKKKGRFPTYSYNVPVKVVPDIEASGYYEQVKQQYIQLKQQFDQSYKKKA